MINHEDALHGVGVTALVTLAGVEDMGAKVGTTILMAVVSTLVSSLVRRWLEKRESRKSGPVARP